MVDFPSANDWPAPATRLGRAHLLVIFVRSLYCTTRVTVAFRVAEPEVAVTVTT